MIVLRVEAARVGARGTDSVSLVDAPHAAALKAAGVDFVVQYLGSVTAEGVKAITDAGLAFMAVTYADKFDGAATVAELAALGVPKGSTVWLDVEGIQSMDPQLVRSRIDAWAESVTNAGHMPGLYVGTGCPLTSGELYDLSVVRYWKAPGSIRDRDYLLAEPACGWCMHQAWPSLMVAGVWSDYDFIWQDYRGRVPSWVVGS